MRVAVVTPFYRTAPDWLAQCHASVRAQTHPATHVLVSDGPDQRPPEGFEGEFIRLGSNHADNGNTPRAAGSTVAAGQGYDAIAYLDADNWYLESHVASLVELHRSTGAAVCTSGRTLHGMDGALLGPCIEVDGHNFADTSCVFLTRKAYALVMNWVLMPKEYSPVCDFWFWSCVRRTGMTTAHSGQATMAFRTSYPHHFRRFGQPVPAGAKSLEYARNCARRIQALQQMFGEHAATLAHWKTLGVRL